MVPRSVIKMIFHYPNGKVYHKSQVNASAQLQKANTFANRGMKFEEAINESNRYYLNHDIAVIHKKPTPVQIVQVDYPKRSAAVIKEAYFKEASTTDYNGVYRGYYLDFEAKVTQNKTSFPLKNFHQHQIEHMKNCLKQNGLCFILLYFSSLKRCFYLDSASLIDFWENPEKKSIRLDELEQLAIEIQLGIAPRVPYLIAVDQFITNKGDTTHG